MLARPRDFRYAVVRQGIGTGTGTIDFTSSGFGTPKAAVFFWTNADVDETSITHARGGYGFTNGFKDRALGWVGRDNQSTTTAKRTMRNDAVLIQIANNGGSITGEAAFDSWITDGVRIDRSNAFPRSHQVTCILFGGDDCRVAMATMSGSASLNGTATAVTNWRPKVLFTISQLLTTSSTIHSDARVMLGCAVDDGNETQGSVNFFDEDSAVVQSVSAGLVSQKYIAHHLSIGGTPGLVATQGALELTSFSGTGFEVTTREKAEAISFAYLAIDTGGAEVDLSFFDGPNSATTEDITGKSFEPGLAMCLSSPISSGGYDAIALGAHGANSFGFGASSIVGGEGGGSCTWQTGQATSNCNSHTDDKLIYLHNASSGRINQATITSGSGSWNTDGVTIDFLQGGFLSQKNILLLFENAPLAAQVDEEERVPDQNIGILRALVRRAEEAVQIEDQALRFLALARLATETVQATDGMLYFISLLVQVGETVELGETLSGFIGRIRQIAEDLELDEDLLLSILTDNIVEGIARGHIARAGLAAGQILNPSAIVEGLIAQAGMLGGLIASIRSRSHGYVSRSGLAEGIVSVLHANRSVVSRAGMAEGVTTQALGAGAIAQATAPTAAVRTVAPLGVVSQAGLAAGLIRVPGR